MIPIKLTNDTWPPKDGEFCSSIVLYYDNWNDYSYRTSFVMCYCDADGMVREVGNVKIYYWQNDEVRTNQYGVDAPHVAHAINNPTFSPNALLATRLYAPAQVCVSPHSQCIMLLLYNNRFININRVYMDINSLNNAEKPCNAAPCPLLLPCVFRPDML